MGDGRPRTKKELGLGATGGYIVVEVRVEHKELRLEGLGGGGEEGR